MPLPKIPTQPATMLLAKDYPKAEPGKSPVRQVAAAADADVQDLISGQAVPTPKSRARRKANDTLAAAQAPAAPVAGATPPAESRKPKAPTPSAKAREPELDQPHPAKHKPVEVTVKSST